MTYAFNALAGDYTRALANMRITRFDEVDVTAKRLLGYVDQGRYAEVSAKTGVPQIVMAASFERESSSNFHTSPAQGDPLWERSVHVPRGLGPYISRDDNSLSDWIAAWAKAAEDAYRIDRLDQVGAANWSWQRACFEEELFNGMGYRAHGIHSPYLWAGSNIYTAGKYVADGVFSYSAVDSQLGVIPMMFRMVELRPSLTLPIAFPVSSTTPTPPVAPQAAPVGLHNAAALQAALNKLGADPQLTVDNSYGRETRRAVEAFQKAHGLTVDGLAGDQTWDAITKAMGATK
jgi:lysozyme family protein